MAVMTFVNDVVQFTNIFALLFMDSMNFVVKQRQPCASRSLGAHSAALLLSKEMKTSSKWEKLVNYLEK